MSAAREPRARRPRSVRASLAAIALSLEVLIVFLAALVLFGLKSLPPAVALGGGGALVGLIVVAAVLVSTRRPRAERVGIVLGWVVQAALLATLAVNVAVGLAGLVFVALWVYCMIIGGRIDRRTA